MIIGGAARSRMIRGTGLDFTIHGNEITQIYLSGMIGHH
jgi:hypothetical protein